MFARYNGALGAVRSTRTALLILVLLTSLAAGCVDEPRPRSYMEFMEDSIAREGSLARCNRDREATAQDAECMNSRRAASTIAARADEALRSQRDAESEVQRAAARERSARVQQAAQQAEAVAEAQAEAEYEAQWADSQEIVLAEQVTATPVSDQVAYNSLGSTLVTAPELDVAEPPTVSLEFIELPESATPALPFVELPSIARRLELPPEPLLEEISIPSIAIYRE